SRRARPSRWSPPPRRSTRASSRCRTTPAPPGYCIEYGKHVSNAGNPEAPESFGNVNLVQGFEHSINSVFCNIGKRLGAATILEYAKRFGFYSIPPLETPTEERAASGLYYNG